MATVTRLHIFPRSFEQCFKDHHWTGQPVILGPGVCGSGLGRPGGRNGLCLKQCRSFRSEEGGEVEEKDREVESTKKYGNLKKSVEAKTERGSGFWKSLETTILDGFSLAHGDEYNDAVAKVETVLSSVSCVGLSLSCFNIL